ncbi:MAG: ABC transporter ATP-binding protein [Aphanocapsa sp. GSE-SYN-MK-11-07L]|jgi:peptide/nickel transport system ATP-binding protein|nr:ABC transporter ATP-binding protein [Aphanocapsa sp. GSE-SYN-MK-11-07L]
MSQSLLSIANLRIAYPQHRRADKSWVVNGVSFQVNPGDRLGLVGESGCGKSTIGRAILQLLPLGAQVAGQIDFNGKSVLSLSGNSLRKFRGEAVSLVFQDPMTRLDPLMTIKDHCLETLRSHRPDLSKQAARDRILSTLAAVKIPEQRWQQYPHEFSGGMRQRVAIALALLLDPKLIVADEPTTSLDVTVAAQILRELTQLCQQRQMGLLLISHDLALVSEYCDRVAVLHQGQIVETGPAQALLQNPQHPYTQALMQAALHLQAGAIAPKPELAVSTPLLDIQNLKQHYSLESNPLARLLSGQPSTLIKAVDGVNLTLYPGETLGLVGESGCGKSTLSRTILQLIRPTAGQVTFLGTELTRLCGTEMRQQRRQIQMIFQDPHACLNPQMTIGQSIADPLLMHGLATPAAAQQQVEAMLTQVGLDPSEFYHRHPADLSGGQQQRVAIARALITHPKLLICDEPVSMLDASIQAQVLDLMLELKQKFNLTYLFITHDLWVARFFCDRLAVMHGGQIVEIGPTHQLFTQPKHPYTQTLLQAAPLLSRLQAS